jgi:protein SCO1/2
VDHEGNERRLELLKGKVIVWSYVYTTCPSGCTGVADEMQKLQKEFGANPKFHLLSISLYPEHDRPAMLKPWVETNRFSGDNWWFLTSPGGEAKDGDVIRKWMFDSFRIPVMRKDEAHILKFPADVWDHPLVMVLTDANGDIRKPTNNDTFWYPFHASYDNGWFPRPIREDVKRLLEEAGK